MKIQILVELKMFCKILNEILHLKIFTWFFFHQTNQDT